MPFLQLFASIDTDDSREISFEEFLQYLISNHYSKFMSSSAAIVRNVDASSDVGVDERKDSQDELCSKQQGEKNEEKEHVKKHHGGLKHGKDKHLHMRHSDQKRNQN